MVKSVYIITGEMDQEPETKETGSAGKNDGPREQIILNHTGREERAGRVNMPGRNAFVNCMQDSGRGIFCFYHLS